MSEALIVLDWSRGTASLAKEADTIKETALAATALIGEVKTAEQHQSAIAGLQQLVNVINLVEKARKAAKEGPLELGRRIDKAAETFVAELRAERDRVSKADGEFVQLEQARIRAAEQARRAEQRKLEEERRLAEAEAMRKAAEERAAIDAKAAEVAKLAAEAQSAEAKKNLAAEQRELERARAHAEAKSHEELDEINARHNQAVADLPMLRETRAPGQVNKTDWDVKVTDIWALARAHPGAVKIEPLMTQIKAMLNAGHKVAGVTATPVTAVTVRANSTPAIDV